MKNRKRSLAITLILALLMMMFSTAAVLAEDDDHGADAHSGTMYEAEEEVAEQEEELSYADLIINLVMSYIPYVIGAICGIIVLVVIIKIIKRSRKPTYTGKH